LENLNRARDLEQINIDKFGLKNLENIINGIGRGNKKILQYYRDGIKYLQQ